MRWYALDLESGVESILRAAIALSKRGQGGEVEPDHVLGACLLAGSRFGIARIGSLVIDLEALGIDWMQDAAASREAQPKVGYSSATVTLLDRASAICRAERAGQVRPVHLLAAFAVPEPQGLMALLAKQGIDGAAWRAALADFDAPAAAPPAAGTAAIRGDYVSPEQAAEILGVHHQTIRGYIRAGKLPALRIAGERAVRIRRENLDRLLEPLATTESE